MDVESFFLMQHSHPTSVVFLAIHDTLLTVDDDTFFVTVFSRSFFFFAKSRMLLRQCEFCAVLRMSTW